MTTLARWRAAHLDIVKEKEHRPYLATECADLQKAEKFRRQIIGEVSKKVAQIQNAGLGEFKLRDLNDEINKLLREKGHWEDQIKELGGPDYRKVGPRMLDNEGKEVPGNRGYKYFGAAKELPGVKELFEQAPPPKARKNRAELMKDINADYYGYRDEDDGVLVPLEQEAEMLVVSRLVEEWKERKGDNRVESVETVKFDEKADDEDNNDDDEDDDDEMTMKDLFDSHTQYIAHVPVPTQQEVEQALVRRKKMELLERYTSESLRQESEEAKKLLNL